MRCLSSESAFSMYSICPWSISRSCWRVGPTDSAAGAPQAQTPCAGPAQGGPQTPRRLRPLPPRKPKPIPLPGPGVMNPGLPNPAQYPAARPVMGPKPMGPVPFPAGIRHTSFFGRRCVHFVFSMQWVCHFFSCFEIPALPARYPARHALGVILRHSRGVLRRIYATIRLARGSKAAPRGWIGPRGSFGPLNGMRLGSSRRRERPAALPACCLARFRCPRGKGTRSVAGGKPRAASEGSMGEALAGPAPAWTRVQLCDVLDLPGWDSCSRRSRRDGERFPFRRHVSCNILKQEQFLGTDGWPLYFSLAAFGPRERSLQRLLRMAYWWGRGAILGFLGARWHEEATP